MTETDAFWSSLVRVSAGTSLTGVIKLTSHTGTNFTYSCEFTNVAGTLYTIANIGELYWLTETLEVYNVDVCADYPKTAFSKMSRIAVKTGSTTPSVTWGVTNNTSDLWCPDHGRDPGRHGRGSRYLFLGVNRAPADRHE